MMEAGNWGGAAGAFARTMKLLATEPKGESTPAHSPTPSSHYCFLPNFLLHCAERVSLPSLAPLPGPSRDQRTAFCAQYYAAVRLLSAASDPSCPAPRAARLYRYLAALKLDDRHTVMLCREAAAKNKAAGYNRCGGVGRGRVQQVRGEGGRGR